MVRKGIISCLVLLMVGLGVGLTAGNASASYAITSATMDWSSLGGLITSGKMSVSNDYVYGYANAWNWWNSQSAGGSSVSPWPVAPLTYTASVNAPSATGSSAEVTYNSLSAQSTAWYGYPPTANANSFMEVYADFVVNQDFTWNVSLPYSLSVSLAASLPAPTSAYGEAYVYMYMYRYYQTPTGWKGAGMYSEQGIYNTVYDGASWSDAVSDTLEVFGGFQFKQGEYGYFYLETWTEAQTSDSQVPVPAAVWLLGGGLVGLVGLKRKFFG